MIMKMDFEKLIVSKGKFWDIKIHHSQNCLGRCLLWYKGNKDKDLLEISKEERDELWELSKKIKTALINLFNPDKFNYLCSGSRTKHLHIHIYPRYSEKREFNGIIFEDIHWGNFTTAVNEVEEALLFKIRDVLKKEIEK